MSTAPAPSQANYSKVLGRLLHSWVICFGMITLLDVAGYWVPHLWMPLLGVALSLPIIWYGKRSIFASVTHCSLLTHYSVYTLLLASAIMMAINLINSRWLSQTFYVLSNPSLPFISALVIYPVGSIMFTIAVFRRKHTEYCAACKQRAGYSMRETLERNVFHHEVNTILRVALVLCYTVSILCWLYYFYYYINININSSDAFFFFIVPFILFLLSVIFVASRCSSLEFEISMSPVDKEITTMVRFMLLRDDKIFLGQLKDHGIGIGLWDNPAIVTIPFTEELSEEKARELLKEKIGTDKFQLRWLFRTNTATHNAFHYMAMLPSDVNPDLDGDWFTIYEIGKMMQAGLVTRPMAFEIHRIYTITMAWKTYDREGRRLYPIRNYRPTFRLTDFKHWDVDYGDLHWLSVAKNNQDRPLYRIRKFWRKYISSADR